MTKTFTKFKGSLFIVLAVSALAARPVLAQFNYRTTSTLNSTGTYTDLGTTGTAIVVANNDDANSAAIPIGFTFNYNGLAFTDFTLNTNGFIKLGNTALANANVFNWVTNSAANIIAPAGGIDLKGAADQVAYPTEFRIATTGTAGSRITTIQFKNLTDKDITIGNTDEQFTRINFQVRLREGTNIIEFVYGPWSSLGGIAVLGRPFLIGLKGTTNDLGNRVLAYKPSGSTPWANVTFYNVIGGTPPPHLVRGLVLPDLGRTYRFTPFSIPANDLSIDEIFVQGKMATTYGTPDRITALVRNAGSTPINNRTVTLTISGNNPLSSTVNISLPPGKDTLVAFAPFMPTVVSNNNFVEVATSPDDNNGNNGRDANIIVTSNIIGYATYPTSGSMPVIQYGFSGFYPATAITPANRNGKFLTKHFTQDHIRVTKIRAFISSIATSGTILYGIVLNAADVEIARSPNLVINNSPNNFVDLVLTTPADLSTETYYIGIVQPAQPNSTAFSFPMGTQAEGDIRRNSFFTAPAVGNTQPEDKFLYRFVIEAEFTNVTGIKEELNAKLVTVYPNPSNGIFNVSAKDMKGSSNVALEVRDIQGKVVYITSAGKANALLNLSKLASGIYMLKVSTDQEVAFKRLVIE